MTTPDQQGPAVPDTTVPDGTVTDSTVTDSTVSNGAASNGAVTPQQQKRPPQHVVKRTRLGGAWVAFGLFALVLLLLLVFILENGHQVKISFFGANGHLPLGVALLMAAVLGVLLVIIPGGGRIMQLRRVAHRHHKAEARAPQA
jgi:lipopolysaccharide assembly protein A